MTLLLHRIENPPAGYTGTNFDPPDKVAAWLAQHQGEPVTFDGVYGTVLLFADANPGLFGGRESILFVTGTYVDKDNDFDVGEPRGWFCDWLDLITLKERDGFEIGWHTWSHPDLTKLDDESLIHEVTPPFPMQSFAYPYGRYDQRVIEAVRAAGFDRAYSTNRGDGTRYALKRFHLPK